MELLLQRSQQSVKKTAASESEKEASPKCSGISATTLPEICVEIDCCCHSYKSCDKTLMKDFDYTLRANWT